MQLLWYAGMMRTIQITPEEDQEIAELRDRLKLPTKKAVVMEGLRSLRQILQDQQRRRRLQTASQAVRRESLRENRRWARRAVPVMDE